MFKFINGRKRILEEIDNEIQAYREKLDYYDDLIKNYEVNNCKYAEYVGYLNWSRIYVEKIDALKMLKLNIENI